MLGLILFEVMLVGYCIFLGACFYSEEKWRRFRSVRNKVHCEKQASM
jgi:hypothetical protein